MFVVFYKILGKTITNLKIVFKPVWINDPNIKLLLNLILSTILVHVKPSRKTLNPNISSSFPRHQVSFCHICIKQPNKQTLAVQKKTNLKINKPLFRPFSTPTSQSFFAFNRQRQPSKIIVSRHSLLLQNTLSHMYKFWVELLTWKAINKQPPFCALFYFLLFLLFLFLLLLVLWVLLPLYIGQTLW